MQWRWEWELNPHGLSAQTVFETAPGTNRVAPPSVGMAGFEPTTARPPAASATKLRHIPMRAPSRIRTCDPLIRNQVRYPLRHQGMVPSEGVEPSISSLSAKRLYHFGLDGMEEGVGFEPTPGASPVRLSRTAR